MGRYPVILFKDCKCTIFLYCIIPLSVIIYLYEECASEFRKKTLTLRGKTVKI